MLACRKGKGVDEEGEEDMEEIDMEMLSEQQYERLFGDRDMAAKCSNLLKKLK